MAKEREEKKKTKRPTAAKRDIRNEKRRVINKSFKSQVRSAIRSLDQSIKNKEKETSATHLNTIYSLMDQGVKRGIYKVNKAGRTKARLAAKVAALSS